MSWEEYCDSMEKDAYGDALALLAISEVNFAPVVR
jgi:hypothetical protein